MKKYCVVSFTDENNKMHTLPARWVISKTTCKWPVRKSASAIDTLVKAGKDITEYETKNIKIYCYAGRYESAELKLNVALKTSDVSDTNSVVNMKRSAELKSDEVLKTSSDKRQKLAEPSDSEFLESDLSEVENLDVLPPLQNNELEDKDTGKISSTTILHKILVSIENMAERVKMLESEVKRNGLKLDQMTGTGANMHLFQDDFIFNFPVSSIEELDVIEDFIKNSESSNKLCMHLSSKMALTMSQMVINIMKYVLTKEVCLMFNLNGLRGKRKFSDLKLCKVIVGAVKIAYNKSETGDILRRISLALVGARDWDGGRKIRTDKGETERGGEEDNGSSFTNMDVEQ